MGLLTGKARDRREFSRFAMSIGRLIQSRIPFFSQAKSNLLPAGRIVGVKEFKRHRWATEIVACQRAINRRWGARGWTLRIAGYPSDTSFLFLGLVMNPLRITDRISA